MTTSWNSTPPEERYDHIGRTLIPNTETVNQVSEALQVSYDSWGTRAEGQVSSIVGHTRFGKSSSVRLFMHKFAKARGGEFIEVHTKHRERKSVAGMDYVVCHDGRQAIKPVIRIAVSASHTYKGLLNDILFYLTGQDKFGRASHPSSSA